MQTATVRPTENAALPRLADVPAVRNAKKRFSELKAEHEGAVRELADLRAELGAISDLDARAEALLAGDDIDGTERAQKTARSAELTTKVQALRRAVDLAEKRHKEAESGAYRTLRAELERDHVRPAERLAAMAFVRFIAAVKKLQQVQDAAKRSIGARSEFGTDVPVTAATDRPGLIERFVQTGVLSRAEVYAALNGE